MTHPVLFQTSHQLFPKETLADPANPSTPMLPCFYCNTFGCIHIEQIMETYQRRRFRKCKESNTEMEQHTCKNGVHASSPLLPTSDDCPIFQLNSANVDHEIHNTQVEVGSVYEIDHIHLPPRTPVQLRFMRVAMVSEKTELNVAVRFPSMESLNTYFSNSIREMYPALDEKFVMGTALAGKVLLRQVPSQQFAEHKHLEGFWLVNDATTDVCGTENSTKKGNCLTELKGNGMVRWGIRRQVKFLERHKENIDDNVQSSLSLNIKGCGNTGIEAIEKPEETDGDNDDDVDEDDDENDEEEQEDDENDDDDDEREDIKEATNNSDEEAMAEEAQEIDRNLKRKRYKLRNSTRQNTKKVKLAKKKQKQQKKKNHGKKGRKRCRELLGVDNPKDRWSAERYQLATKNLLAVMKAKGATAGKPILRPDLRAEARKRIGDTGLLDHLLKHMAGKLAPGGEERFRRRHNADGAMEYWLESASLVNLRKEAGVNDPYWVPPPGWKPGDCPTQDPICARELKLLKEEICQLKRNARDMVPRKQLEQELRKLRREIDKIVSNKKQEEKLAIGLSSNTSVISQKLDQLADSEKHKEQLLVIKDFVKGIEEEIKKLMPGDDEGKTRPNTALMVSKEPGAEKEKQLAELEHETKEQEVQEVVNIREDESDATAKAEKTTAAAMAEKKAAKIERLKSGFRICKPQGTFLWPNMARNNCNNTVTTSTSSNIVSPQVVVQVEDLFVVPTPPSVSSSTSLAPPQLPYHPNHNNIHPTSPVKKPLAERRAVKVTVSTLTNEHGDGDGDKSYSTTNKKTSHINLNDIPSNHVEGFYGKPPTVMPRLQPDEVKKAKSSRSWEVMTGGVGSASGTDGARETTGHVQKKLSTSCSSSALCLSAEEEMGTWLALATANSASDESSQG